MQRSGAIKALRSEIGFLFQGGALYNSMTVREHIKYPMRRHKEKLGNVTETAPLLLEALENVGFVHTMEALKHNFFFAAILGY